MEEWKLRRLAAKWSARSAVDVGERGAMLARCAAELLVALEDRRPDPCPMKSFAGQWEVTRQQRGVR